MSDTIVGFSANARSERTRSSPSAERFRAWAVHLYTAMGAALALGATEATARSAYAEAFRYLAAAMFIDCTDGTFARRFRVREVLPHFDGSRLDDIVDYLNYTFVPVWLAWNASLLPSGLWGASVASIVLLASAYGFSRSTAKTPDHFFTGFPSYWNVVVLYLYLLELPTWANASILLVLAGAVFLPFRYLYPSRNPFARRTTYLLGSAWGALMLFVLYELPAVPRPVVLISLFFPAYYVVLSLWVHFRAPSVR
ncbi:MAG: phosphatidylcholine synthase [Candidatus Binatia bacterium]|nr:MAG: phosphatidylcholine synthase [Candidatus Binatia bacterium]